MAEAALEGGSKHYTVDEGHHDSATRDPGYRKSDQHCDVVRRISQHSNPERLRSGSTTLKCCSKVIAEPRGWIVGFRVWVLAGYDDGTLIAEVSENMGNNNLKYNAFLAALRDKGYDLTIEQKDHLLKELLISVCPPTFVGGIRDSRKHVTKLAAVAQMLKVLVHIGPIALVQFTDYITDLLVILQFFQDGNSGFAWAAVGFVAASVVISGLMILISSTERRLKGFALLLVPLNLHILCFGYFYAEAKAALASHESEGGSSERESELWQQYREALRTEDEACRKSDMQLFARARSCRERAEAQLQEDARFERDRELREDCQNLHGVFVWCKAVEAGIESVPLAVLSASTVLSGSAALSQSGVAVFGASLALSALSMAYGFFSFCDEFHSTGARDDHRISRTEGRKPQLFCCYVVNVVWSLMACGLCLSTSALGRFNLTLLALPAAVAYFPVGGVLFSKAFQTISGRSVRSACMLLLNAALIALGSVIFAMLSAPVDLLAMRRQKVEMRAYYWLLPLLRRLALLAMAIVAVAADFSPVLLAVVVVSFTLDLICSAYLLHVLGPHADERTAGEAVADLESEMGSQAEGIASQPLFLSGIRSDLGPDSSLRLTGPPQSADESVALDLLWAVKLHAERSTRKAEENENRRMLELMQAMRSRAAELSDLHPTLSADQRRAIQLAVEAYVPTDDGGAESVLLRHLHVLQPPRAAKPKEGGKEEGGAESGKKEGEDQAGKEGGREEGYVHPLRGARLQHALKEEVWSTTPSFFGSKVEGTAFELSHDVARCDYFVSHAWLDVGSKKVRMLRNYICLQQLVGRIIVVSVLLALFLVPLGIALHAQSPAFHLALLPGTTLAGLLLALLWVAASSLNIVGARYTPWALSSTTLWIDKLCIDQRSDETKAAGVASFPVVLQSCDYMVALISADYFRRVWCVYELAMFAKDKSEWLLLFSMDWPSLLSPFKTARLTPEEEAVLHSFSFESADCFVPRDRVTVLRAIRQQFGSVEQFEAFVRHRLPQVLARSKQSYYTQLSSVAMAALALAFGG